MRSRAIYGCAGPELSEGERSFFREAKPWGFILFGRNIVDRAQVRRLVQALRESIGDAAAPVLIDQEGGRVARLQPPHWKARAPAEKFGALHDISAAAATEAAYLNARLIAHDLFELGITVDCAPVLDVPVDGAHVVIGNRAYARDPAVVVELGRAVIAGLVEGGVLPVMKHIPGHGRAGADSHLLLPRVSAPHAELSMSDFVCFRGLADCPMAMTAHVVFEDIDPVRPATTSARVIHEIIRGEIGFDGLLMTDDLTMKALTGTPGARARAALAAGCDVVLHCSGSLEEMQDVARETGPLDDIHGRRAAAALAHCVMPEEIDIAAGEARLAALLGNVV
jgi:beta-N-acetylhexosaminidase